MQDGAEDDVFQIFNTYGATDLDFNGSGSSTLAVDAFLGPPGSTSDIFIIDGNVSGKTEIKVNNTNPGPGAVNTVGIPVVFVNGNVKGDEFFLPQLPCRRRSLPQLRISGLAARTPGSTAPPI
jgi:hypothetical protein